MADFLLGGQIDPVKHERTDALTTVASGDFTTHGVIVGMTGSGKTGLGIVLVEEALTAGVPALLIDPKGDLTNLCLTFPNLAAADFQPWVSEGDATKAGQSIADFAAAQAKSVDRRSWRRGGNRAGSHRRASPERDLHHLHAGLEARVSRVNIVGSLQAPSDVSDAGSSATKIRGFVGGLLSLMGIDADPLSSREHILLSNLILNEWTGGRSLDLPTLVGLVQQPPIRKLGVFELDQFFPQKDRTAFAIRLNGLLASPSFGAWMAGPALDIGTMLKAPTTKPRCAIVTPLPHLRDQERQFVTTLILSKLVTWMRKQSGTTDLRALLYMDEVAGYLPPTAMPPTKKPIMTLMKQARAFGVGVVLSTQNPVDVDYKALSNAGTWMIGRLQTDQDKQRLLDGMSAASGGVDVAEVGNTIAGLAKREFVLRRAGKDHPEVFTTRWAMSYLRGPLTRDQIAQLMADQKVADTAPSTVTTDAATPAAAAPAAAPALSGDDTTVLPQIADGAMVRWADVAAPWLATIGGDSRGTRYEASIVARVSLRYDDEKADPRARRGVRGRHVPARRTRRCRSLDLGGLRRHDLRAQAPAQCVYRLPAVSVKDKTFWARRSATLIDYLVRSRTVDLPANRDLKLYGRPAETADDFTARCLAAANDLADKETASLRSKYEAKVTRLQTQIQAAEDRAEVLNTQRKGRQSEEVLSTAGSILGGLLGGRRSRGGMLGSILGKAGSAAGRRSRTAAAGDRLDAAENKLGGLHQQLEDLEAELTQEVTDIDAKWMATAKNITTLPVSLERTDVKVTQLALVWIPVP
jgi:hypothetical protein